MNFNFSNRCIITSHRLYNFSLYTKYKENYFTNHHQVILFSIRKKRLWTIKENYFIKQCSGKEDHGKRVNIEFSCSPDLTPKAAVSQRSLDTVMVISESVVIINSHLLFHCPPSHISYIRLIWQIDIGCFLWWILYEPIKDVRQDDSAVGKLKWFKISKVRKTLEIRRLPRKSYADTLEPSSQGALTTVSGWAG